MSQVDHIWTVACSRAVIDHQSNNVSLESVIEQITIQGEPAPDALLAMPLDVMTLWSRSEPDVPCRALMRFSFVSPSSTALGPKEVDIDLQQAERYRSCIHMDGLPVSEPGRHVFRIELKEDGEGEWHQVASIPLTIAFVPPNQEPRVE